MVSPSPLLSLPEEMIEHICWQLVGLSQSSSHDPRSLSSLCRTSKIFNRIATPILYARFHAQESMKKIACFLRSISLRPELGGYVQETFFSTFYWVQLTECNLEIFSDAAARLGVNLENWMTEHPYEAMVQLIIAQTPNVRIIEVPAHEVLADDGVGAFTLLEQIAAQVPRRVSLSCLRQLIVGHDDCRRVSLGYFGGIIELAPHIREIIMSPCYGLHCDEEHVNDRLSLKNVTRLKLDGGHMSKSALESIVRLCGELKIFEYNYQSIYAGLGAVCVTPREVIEILTQHRNTLCSVYLDLGDREREDSNGFCFSGLCADGDQILSLKDFSRLESFRVDGSSVLFPQVQMPGYHTNILINLLPKSIRRFYLTDAQKESVANMIRLMDMIDDFPLLEEVTLTGNSIHGPLGDDEVIFDKSEVDTLRQMMENIGAKFKESYDTE
ncbi:hypothetical protein ACHAQJ_002941 [Trichoderma viride]